MKGNLINSDSYKDKWILVYQMQLESVKGFTGYMDKSFYVPM
jgi:hypothetical protein